MIQVGIDPLLIYLEQNLSGIPIMSLPVLGPSAENDEYPLPVLKETFKFMAYCDDVKPAITSINEFFIADHGAALFEGAAGTRLHRDLSSNKCKFLALGKWRQELSQDMIPTPYMKLTDTLDMVGVQLCANWSETRRKNGESVRHKIQKLIGCWRSGKFLPLTQRPFSANTYALSKIWFRTGCVNLRESDFKVVNSSVKKWLYADLFFKPEEMVLFRKVGDGGLGLTSCRHKSLAHLIRTFLELAANPAYVDSLYLNILYRTYVLEEGCIVPHLPPYYNKHFFDKIIQAKKAGYNIIKMTVKQWYTFLMEQDVTMESGNQQEKTLRPCRVEKLYSDVQWKTVWANIRMSFLGNCSKTFAWKLAHDLLPTEERLGAVGKNIQNVCKFSCAGNPVGNLEHCLFHCQLSEDVGTWLIDLHKTVNPEATSASILRLDLIENCELLYLSIKTFQFCWTKRLAGKRVTVIETIAYIVSDVRSFGGTRHGHLIAKVENLLR